MIANSPRTLAVIAARGWVEKACGQKLAAFGRNAADCMDNQGSFGSKVHQPEQLSALTMLPSCRRRKLGEPKCLFSAQLNWPLTLQPHWMLFACLANRGAGG